MLSLKSLHGEQTLENFTEPLGSDSVLEVVGAWDVWETRS